MIHLPNLILASASPRRSEILSSVGWNFEKYPADIDETELIGELPAAYVERLAREKAEVVSSIFPNAIVLGADTTVVINEQIIGKPTDLEDARRMLTLLAGNWHEVLTGVAVVKESSTVTGVQRTRVKFKPMSEPEINFLVETGDPLDKAGAYAVQAQAALFIDGIEGDYWNVVGLPVGLVYDLIMKRPDAAVGPQ